MEGRVRLPKRTLANNTSLCDRSLCCDDLRRKNARRRVLIREMEALGERGVAVDSLESLKQTHARETAKLAALTDAIVDLLVQVGLTVQRGRYHFVLKKWDHHIVGNREVPREFGKWLGDGGTSRKCTTSTSLSSWSRKVGMIWSFGFLGVCKRTKIPFVCEDGLAIEWNSEDLSELLEGKSDEFVLNHEGDKNDSRVIFLKSYLTIKV
ncbi:hypothetical protein Tco_0925127 [Tanacetum coccineum]|uniref:Uncharacterized protein n=1 Tax=Tanacetum coccineum TaxID=301880 RepID=A0ABQ5D8S8_9ASTR